MKSVLVTGTEGFLGKHLVTALLKKGYKVYAIARSKKKGLDSSNPYLKLRYLDLNKIMCYIDEFPDGIDVMYHLAWSGVRPELRDDLNVQMSNINMSMDCMKFASAKGIKKVIFPGSTNEYLYYGKPLNKNAIPSPQNLYGASKTALRYLAGNYARKNNIEFIYAIITGIYASDRRDNNVIFYTIDKLLRGEKPCLTRLEQLWDYVYIDDVIEALILMGEKGKDGAVYAVGHGDNWPLYKYIEIIHKKIDPRLPLGIGEVPYSNGILPCSCIDLTDIHKDTGFEPKIDFDKGISLVIDRIKEEKKV
ncbi:NAD(P)-dependent oxidoreductase [Clostridiaceae bacterium AF18-31LB]|nr:NAD(P)-dependent oxidoreductase [Clostridiaceae bacterium AF18-31LB]